jgi:plasmid stabilization system protein ParE
MRIVWSFQSRGDLREIRKFIARDSPVTAANFIRKLKVSVERLRVHPESGQVVRELGSSTVREILFGQYRIIYQCGSKRIEILAVFHGARLLGETEF